MLTLEATAQFRRDFVRMKKLGYSKELLMHVVDSMLNGKLSEFHCNVVKMIVEPTLLREYFIQPDWALIYRIDNERLILVSMQLKAVPEVSVTYWLTVNGINRLG